MPNITIKNIPDNAYEALKKVAEIHRRSINSEIIYIIEEATLSKKSNPELHLASARRSRDKTKKILLTSEILHLAKGEGRP